jgi:predicted nucleotidyltransferase
VDILVQFSEDIGWEFVDLKQFLEENLERKVDLVTLEALKPELKEEILRDVIYQ